MNALELYNEFSNNFKQAAKISRHSDNVEWIMNVYHYFCQVGAEAGFNVFAKSNVFNKPKRDYLADVCWRNEALPEYCHYKGLEMVMESEWLTGLDEITWDVCRLIDIKSLLKVMVIGVKNNELDKALEQIFLTIKQAQVKFEKEEYLVIAFVPVPDPKNPEKVLIYGYKVDHQGTPEKLKELEFVFS